MGAGRDCTSTVNRSKAKSFRIQRQEHEQSLSASRLHADDFSRRGLVNSGGTLRNITFLRDTNAVNYRFWLHRSILNADRLALPNIATPGRPAPHAASATPTISRP